MNRVIAGDYEGYVIVSSPKGYVLGKGFSAQIRLNKENIESYEVITEDIRKSAASGVTRGIVGGALLGPVGLLAGLSAKNKGTYNIALEFKDGKRSLIEADEKVYKSIVKEMF
jgi:hypothetical protein